MVAWVTGSTGRLFWASSIGFAVEANISLALTITIELFGLKFLELLPTVRPSVAGTKSATAPKVDGLLPQLVGARRVPLDWPG